MAGPLVAYVLDTLHADPGKRLEAETSAIALSMIVAGATLDELLEARGVVDPDWLRARAGELAAARIALEALAAKLGAVIEGGGAMQ